MTDTPQDVVETPTSEEPRNVNGNRLNRRGMATREHVLRTAIKVLASGDPNDVRANVVAKEAGVTWGTVRHTFGDADGVWAAMLRYLMPVERILPEMISPTAQERVQEIVEVLWSVAATPLTTAVNNLRSALPPDFDDILATYPQTAQALHEWDERWRAEYDATFHGLDVSPQRAAHVRDLLPVAVRGLLVELRLGTLTDIDGARAALAAGMGLYLTRD